MFRVQFPSQELRGMADDARRQLVEKRTELLHSLGAELVKLVKESFLRRSRGGAGAGITWDRLTDSRVKAKHRQGLPGGVGIATGQLYESAGYQIQGNGLFVEFSAPHAAVFDELRTLLPDDLTEAWRGELERLASEWGDDILVESFE